VGRIMIRRSSVDNFLGLLFLVPFITLLTWALSPDSSMRSDSSSDASHGISSSRGYSKKADITPTRSDSEIELERLEREQKDYSDFLTWKPKWVKASDFRTYGARYHAPGHDGNR